MTKKRTTTEKRERKPNWLGRAFVELGFLFKKSNGIRCYLVVRRSPEEMRSVRHAPPMAALSRTAGADRADGADVF